MNMFTIYLVEKKDTKVYSSQVENKMCVPIKGLRVNIKILIINNLFPAINKRVFFIT